MLIKEITRRINLLDRWQAVYTAGVVLPKPVGKCRYHHRSLNPKKLIEVCSVNTFALILLTACTVSGALLVSASEDDPGGSHQDPKVGQQACARVPPSHDCC